MKKKLLMFIVFVTSLSCFLIFNLTSCYAWKPKTHVYSANLIAEEIKANNGYVEIPPYGKFKVRDEYVTALKSYPDYFRAGAIGPDTLPDIYVGQSIIHPDSSDVWIKHVWDCANNIPPYSPDRLPAVAFALGFSTHYSGDLFGHSYINVWAKGKFPDVGPDMTKADIENISRHMIVENYIDKKIPFTYTAEYNKTFDDVKIPKDFIMKTFISNETWRRNTSNPKEDTYNINNFYNNSLYPKHFELFFETRENLKNYIINNQDSKKLYTKALVAYAREWMKDIDIGLDAWVDTNEKATGYMLAKEGGMSKVKEVYEDWATNHLLSMMGSPDAVGGAIDWILNLVGDISSFVENMVPEKFRDVYKSIQNGYYDTLSTWAFGIEYSKVVEFEKNPEYLINYDKIFEANSLSKLNKDMGNFAYTSSSMYIDFAPFYNTVIMAKLNLIGDEGIASLCKKAGVSNYVSGSEPAVGFVKSLDLGYVWQSPSFEGFKLWDNQAARKKVFNKIFKMKKSSLDIAFVIDTTGSMWDDIDKVKSSAKEIVDSLDSQITDYRVAVVDFRDYPASPYGSSGDYEYKVNLPFSNDKTAIVNAIQGLTIGDGNDWEESVYTALMKTVNAEGLGNWREESSKMIILMGDAPPHDPEPYTNYNLAAVTSAANGESPIVVASVKNSALAASLLVSTTIPVSYDTQISEASSVKSPIQIYSIAIGSNSTTSDYFSKLAEQTGGKFYTAPTSNDVVSSILESISDFEETKVVNNPPDCSWAVADIPELWPANNKMNKIQIKNIKDPDGDPFTITITGITQDEPVTGKGKEIYDAIGIGTDTAWIRASRNGSGNGRVYKISFVAKDDKGAESNGSVLVGVKHDNSKNNKCIDDGQNFESSIQ